MPIRTRRGRAAAYRSVWEWPLRSPLRLVGCVAVVAALALGISTLSDHAGAGDPAAPAGSATPSAPAGASGSSDDPGSPGAAPGGTPPAPELVPSTLPVSQAPPEALEVARRWTEAWANHPPGTTAARWSEGLAPFTTEEYLPVLGSVDPANVPGTRVTGPPQAVQVRPEAVRVQVPTDAVRLELLLVAVAPGQWRVSGYDGAS